MVATIDQSRCVACKNCTGYSPGVFRMSALGPAEVYTNPIPTDQERSVCEAMKHCTMQVISVDYCPAGV